MVGKTPVFWSGLIHEFSHDSGKVSTFLWVSVFCFYNWGGGCTTQRRFLCHCVLWVWAVKEEMLGALQHWRVGESCREQAGLGTTPWWPLMYGSIALKGTEYMYYFLWSSVFHGTLYLDFALAAWVPFSLTSSQCKSMRMLKKPGALKPYNYWGCV